LGIFDFLRRFGSGRRGSRQRGVRGPRDVARSASEGTVQIRAPQPGPMPPPQAPQQPAPPPQAAPAATVVTPASPPPQPQAPTPAAPPVQPAAPAAPPPAAVGQGQTEYVDVRSVMPSQVVGVLVAVEGELEGEIYRLCDGENKLGRSPDCEVVMNSKRISRHHAKVIHQDGVFAVAPLSDQNPTLLNDEPTEGAELKDGDYVRVGRTNLRFRSII
jgi:hypothetical protein